LSYSHIGTPDASLGSLEESRALYDLCLQNSRSSQQPAGNNQSINHATPSFVLDENSVSCPEVYPLVFRLTKS
jgi:hypothetical protein